VIEYMYSIDKQTTGTCDRVNENVSICQFFFLYSAKKEEGNQRVSHVPVVCLSMYSIDKQTTGTCDRVHVQYR
jgi:hypothetical protein